MITLILRNRRAELLNDRTWKTADSAIDIILNNLFTAQKYASGEAQASAAADFLGGQLEWTPEAGNG